MPDRPIGFFDSGLGGASVLKQALRLLPREDYVYYGDNGHAPYGERSREEIERLTFAGVEYLVQQRCKALVIACNTATAAAIEQLRQRFSLPILSVEPAIKPACEAPGSGKVLMMATFSTTHAHRYLELKARMPDPQRVIDVACPGIVPHIEAGELELAVYEPILDELLSPYWGMQIDSIVLGCTHFPFIREVIAAYAKAHFQGECILRDGSMGTCRHLKQVLERDGLINDHGSGKVMLHTTGDPQRVERVFRALLER